MSNVCEKIAENALRSLLYEVSATPKPGLVDRCNSGAHHDMDFYTFMSSSASLVFYFHECALRGMRYAGRDPRELFDELRNIGKNAERDMFAATGGVNTHKGLVFSLGILSAAVSSCAAGQKTDKPDLNSVCAKTSEMTRGICERELANIVEPKKPTHGENVFAKYGFKGARGEVEDGFPTVRAHSLPILRRLKKNGSISLNDIFVQTLLCLIAVNEDTNIVARHGKEALDYAMKYAANTLDAGGALSEKGKKMIFEMDRDFNSGNISPGGSADLLAVTIMLDLVCKD